METGNIVNKLYVITPEVRYICYLTTNFRSYTVVKNNDTTGTHILTTNLAAVVWMCVSVQNLTNFCPHAFISNPNVPKKIVRIAKFPYAAFGPLFAFHYPLFFTRNNDLECKSSRFAAVVRRSVTDRQLHLNGVIRSAGVAQWQELGPKT